MIELTLSELAAIFLVICIAVVPLWYPRYSFFHRNAATGIDHLRRTLTVQPSDEETTEQTRIATLEAGDRGFSELVHTIRAQTHVTDRPVRIELIHTDSDPEYDTLVVGGGDVSTGEHASLRLEYEAGTETIVETPDSDVDRILELVDLRQWVTSQTLTRSHHATVVLVVLWGTVSVVGLW
ncbi:hypothetical protein OB955_09500 [Halobacteria archaeon AArc-m2/3/4]|uniref:Uncharacterized protein n=1 Tax=Natronoglomus mannanivorans TaxID=2979990 RepID=A0ABT2QDJ4_9EURY|nr:hypothetical protein [Halobacteria archaeon AArc-m2/3/4]